jgi:hypothetical protein
MVSRTEEAKFALLDSGSQDWGTVINGVIEALDAGAELTFVFGEAVTAGDCVAVSTSDGLIYKAVSSSQTLTPAIGFAPNSVAISNQGKVRGFGWIDVDTSFSYSDSVSWSPGEAAYVGSVAGRLAKTRYSWSNPVAWAKSFTDASWTTRFAIAPKLRQDEIKEALTVEKKIVFVSEIDNGESGSAKTIDWTQGNKQKLILTDNCVMSMAHPFGVAHLTLKLIQDGTGSRTVTWPATVKWPSGTAPTLTTTAWGIDLIVFYHDGLNYYGGSGLDYQ